MSKKPWITIFTILSTVLGFSTANAQTLIWGAGHSNSAIDSMGRFAKPAITVDSMGLDTLGWTVDTMSCGARWEWSADGVLPSGTLSADFAVNDGIGEWITSTSIADGCAIFNTDMWENAGLAGSYVGAGPCPVFPNYHSASMYSPSIDLSTYVDSALQITFHVSYLDFRVEPHTVGISIDGGATWTDINYSILTGGTNVQSSYNGEVTVFLPENLLVGANPADLTDCQIRFNFEGIFYFITVDDVRLETVDPAESYDLTFAPPILEFRYLNALAPMEFTDLPLSQIAAANTSGAAQDYVVAAYAYNKGHKTIPSTANPRVIYDIQYNDNGTWVSQLLDSVAYTHDIATYDTATIAGVSSGGILLGKELSGFAPAQVGTYRIAYTLAHDLSDADSDNNTQFIEFNVTDDWYSMSKSSGTAIDYSNYDLYPGVYANSTAGSALEFEAGNIYNFPAGDGYYIDSIHYVLKAGGTFNGNYGGKDYVVEVRLHKWLPANDTDNDGHPDLDEFALTITAKDSILVDGTGVYSRSVVLYDPNTINPVSGIYDYPYILEDDAMYYISVYQSTSLQDSLFGDPDLVETNGAANCFMIATHPVYHTGLSPFGFSTTVGGLLSSGGLQYSGAAGSVNGGMITSFTDVEKFANAIAVKITDTAPTSSNVRSTQNLNENVEVYPNPVSTVVSAAVDLDYVSKNIRYVITDLTGRVLHIENHSNVQNEVFNFDIRNYDSGVYFMNITTDAGTRSMQFVKK